MKDKRYFLLDKNYLLKATQQNLKSQMLQSLIGAVKQGYHQLYNPLGLQDETTKLVDGYQLEDYLPFEAFYEYLCAVYRYQIGTNQLEFLFDGTDHYSKYTQEFELFCEETFRVLCGKTKFIKAVLAVTVFFRSRQSVVLAESRLKHYVCEHFKIKISRGGIRSLALSA